MSFTLRTTLISLFLLLLARTTYSQCNPAPVINFQNPSFEGTPSANFTPAPWTECMPGQTPDTQPGSWGVTLPPTNGSSYIGLVHEPSASWQEGAAEPLSTPFLAGITYSFTVDLANSSTTGGGIFPGCAECEIWGGFSACDQNTLLWHSGNITPYDTWQTYTVTFTPTQNFTWCMFQVNSLGCSSQPYILVDNIGPVHPSNVTATIQRISNDHCAGDSTGKAIVHAIGQNPPFIYNWSSPLITSDTVLNNVPAGTCTVTVTDANTCSSTASVTITQPAPLTLTPTVVPATCFGSNTGSAYMSYAGGTQPMTFVWSNGPTTQNNSNLFAGLYNITVTDSAGCKATGGATITQPTQLSITGTVTNATCAASNGSIAATAAGGTSPYTYLWSTTPAQTTATATGLAAGSYTITVTDNKLCTATSNFTVSQPPNGMTGNIAVTNILCFGQSTGAASSLATGGSPPYTYLWSNSATTQSINNLAAGIYTVTISDQSGCGFVLDTLVAQPDSALRATINKTDIKCFGQNDGSATAVVTGGTPAYTYSWSTSPQQTTAGISNLASGNYTITVTDANLCTVTATNTINQPTTPLAITETQVNVLCYGGSTGSITTTTTGGLMPYAYRWAGGQTTSAITGLIAAAYTVTVTDTNQCTATVSAIITQPATPLQVTDSFTTPLCFGQTAATITSSATGGTPGYTYLWNTTPPQSTQTVSNIPAGTYAVMVTDANSCTASASITVASPPTALTVTTMPVNVSCFGTNTGSIRANASGGVGNYTYLWNTTPTQITATASQLTAGNYSVTVADANGCTVIATDTVRTPPQIVATDTVIGTYCSTSVSGKVIITATGGVGMLTYTYTPAGASNNTGIFNGLPTGNYSYTVADTTGCSVSDTFNVSVAPADVYTSNTEPVSCYGFSDGNITITPDSLQNGPFTYAIAGGAYGSSNIFDSLSAGIYQIYARNNYGCTDTLLDTVSQPGQQTISFVPDTVIAIANNATSLSPTIVNFVNPVFTWTPAKGLSCTNCANPSATITTPTLFYVTISDSLNTICVVTDSVWVLLKGPLVMPTAFTPNGDGKNDLFGPVSHTYVVVKEFHIYNRWGQLVHNGTDYWDGKFDNKEQPSGTYIYYIEGEYLDPAGTGNMITGKEEGSVTLLR